MAKPKPPTWESVVVRALERLGGEAHLSELYEEVARMSNLKSGRKLTKHYIPKVRQVVQKSKRICQPKSMYKSGIWRLAKTRGRPRAASR